MLLHALCASAVTSILPALLLGVLPRAPPSWVLHTLVASASGAILADALFHMLPELVAPHDDNHLHEDQHHDTHAHGSHHDHHHHHHHHDINPRLVLVVVGVLAFLLFDAVLRRVGAGHSHGEPQRPSDRKSAQQSAKKGSARAATTAASSAVAAQESVAAVSLVADGAHNFADGVVIAMAFAQSLQHGWRTSVAVLLHELPHEVGDYAVLKQCGYTVPRIVAVQVMTGAANGVGVASFWALGELSGDVAAMVKPLLVGGFLYMSLSTLLADVRDAMVTAPLWQAAIMAVAFLVGVAAVLCTGFVEDALGAHAH